MLTLLTAALAADCATRLGDTEPDGVVPMYASCHWADVDPARVGALIGDPGAHDRVFSRVIGAKVLGTDGDVTRVWQRHAAPPIADREVVVAWRHTRQGATDVWTWRTVPAALPLVAGDAVVARWEGTWRVTPDGRGGAYVEHENHYAATDFPGWMLRPFLGGELDGVLDQLRAAAQ